MPRLIPITAQQAQSYIIGQNAPNAALQQPGAQLGQTLQSTATSQAEQQNIQTQTGINQVKQQAANYPLNLEKDLKGGMTLQKALDTYSSLMKPADIFTQYLNQSPYKLPKETPTQLINMGIPPEALGKIGDPSSFMDRWNTKNAIQELRGLHDTWNQTDAISHIPFLGDTDASARAYTAQKQAVGEHLSSLIPGASQSQGSNQGFLNSLPSIGDVFAPGAASGQFNKIEQALLQSKGYSYQDLGLTAPKAEVQGKGAGGDLLKTLLSGAKVDISNMTQGFTQNAENNLKNPLEILKNPTGSAVLTALGIPLDQKGQQDYLKGVINEYSKATGAGQNGKLIDYNEALNHLVNHPVQTAVDALPLLSMFKGGGDIAPEETPKTPTGEPNLLTKLLDPKKSFRMVGQARDSLISASDNKAGNTLTGNDFIKQFTDEANKQKMSGSASLNNELDQEIKNVTNQFKDKVLKPSDLKDAYDRIKNSYTTKGSLKTTNEAVIDNLKQNLLSQNLEKLAPGWNDINNQFYKLYQMDKNPNVKSFRGIPGKIATGAAYTTGYEVLKHIFPWL